MGGGSLRSVRAMPFGLFSCGGFIFCLRPGGCYLNQRENRFFSLAQKLSFFFLAGLGEGVGFGVGMITTGLSAVGVMLGVADGTSTELLGVGVTVVLYDGAGVSLREGAGVSVNEGLGVPVIDGLGRLNLCHNLVVPFVHTFLTLTIALYTAPILLFNVV